MTPMNRRQWQRTMAKWDTFENVLGTRDTLWEDIEEFGTLAQATDQRRTESRWDAGREGSGNSKADNGRREQCRLLLDWTRGFMRLRLLSFLRLLSEKIETSDCTRGQCPCFVYWCKHWRGDTIGYLVRPVGLETVLSRTMGTNWSPVFLVGAKKGESPGWCGVLNVGVDNLQELEENWVDKCAEVGQPGGARKRFSTGSSEN